MLGPCDPAMPGNSSAHTRDGRNEGRGEGGGGECVYYCRYLSIDDRLMKDVARCWMI